MTETAAAGPIESPGQVQTSRTADVRGYTSFALEQGDEAAARLALQFADLSGEAVAARGGRVIEVRGDEILAVFSSARRALQAAIDLQDRVARSPMPLGVGAGLDAGEAVPVADGYRGVALNLAARLCSLAGPGEILASEGVVHLARKVEGLAYRERGRMALKGFTEPVGVLQVVPDDGGAGDRATSTGAIPDLPIGGFLGALPEGQLVARERELVEIEEAVEAVLHGAGRLVLLAGEARKPSRRSSPGCSTAARKATPSSSSRCCACWSSAVTSTASVAPGSGKRWRRSRYRRAYDR